jgi:hypothetical protein
MLATNCGKSEEDKKQLQMKKLQLALPASDIIIGMGNSQNNKRLFKLQHKLVAFLKTIYKQNETFQKENF